MQDIADYLRFAATLPGWTVNEEAPGLAEASFAAPDNAVIVEIGSFFGAGTIILAGPRKLRGSGRVHAVDPFDGSGDDFSVPVYDDILAERPSRSLREHFDHSILTAGLTDWVEVHVGRATDVAAGWRTPIDLLFLDGDQSPAGARAAFEAWEPWLKPGGLIAVHNSNPRDYGPGHDGHYLIAQHEIVPPRYTGIEVKYTTTFARKT